MDADAPVDGRPCAWPALAAAALSGVTALVAQTVWIRALGRALGTTTESLAAVAGVFLAGLGLGAWWGARLVRRSSQPALTATRALLASATLVALSPWLFTALPDLHLSVLRMLGAEPGPNPWPALVVGLPLLLVPTLLMGCTFPLLVAARTQQLGEGRAGVGVLYGVNTAGAAVGALATVLALPGLGEQGTLLGAAACEALAALAAWTLAQGAAAGSTPGALPSVVAAPALPALRPARVGALLALTGLCGLGAEVAAFRLLEPLAGPHLWGVVLLLLPVLAGLALGGVLGGRIAARSPRPVLALTVAVLLAGVGMLALPALAGLLPRLVLEAGAPLGLQRVVLLALGSALALLPVMVASGACFPLGVRVAHAQGESPAAASGRLGAANALGALVGSLLVGFALLPLLGAAHVLLLLASLLLAAAPLWHLAHARERRVAVACVAALPLGLLALPPVHAALRRAAPGPALLVAVTARPPPVVPRAGEPPFTLQLEGAADAALYAHWFGGRPTTPAGHADGPLLPPRDGRMGTISLLEEPGGVVRLRSNGLSEAQLDPTQPGRGSATEVALGLLPMLSHPAPRRALVIGHGAGWTAETVLAAGIEALDVAELDATLLEVVEDWRGHPLPVRHDPRARLWLADGRLLLRRAAHGDVPRYDVIASQPSHPWVPGAGHLFTLEAYQLARAALAPGGVFAQWLNLFEMSPDLLRSALATFRAAFPECWVFLFPQEAVLVGFEGKPALDGARWERLLERDPAVQSVAQPVGLHKPGDLWRRLVMDGRGVERVAPASAWPALRDDLPRLELGLAWRVLSKADAREALEGRRADLGTMLRSAFPPDLQQALPEPGTRARFTQQAVQAWLSANDMDMAVRWDKAADWGDEGEALLTRAALARARGETLAAEGLLRRAVRESPGEVEWAAGWIGLLSVGVVDRPDLCERALQDAERVAAQHPGHGSLLVSVALLRAACGDYAGARREYEQALKAASPAAPPDTAARYARLLLLGGVPGPRVPLGPDLGDEMLALSLLRTAPGAGLALDDLELRVRLEARLGDAQNLREAEAQVAQRRRSDARQAVRNGWGWLLALDGSALGEAQRAMALDPSSVEACELCALALLQAARATQRPAEVPALQAAAQEQLAKALRASAAGQRQDTRARGEAYLRWFGVEGVDLQPAEDE